MSLPAHVAGQTTTLALSVCICTFNRAGSLRQTLARLGGVRVPPGVALEVVVVDNNSSDATREVLAEVRDLPLRVVGEPRPGLASARNAGVGACSGEYILWTDDDVLVDPGWLEAYVAAIRAHPDAGFFGGPILPHLEGRPPGWLPEVLPELSSAYALRDFPPGIGPLGPDTLPYGANFLVRRSLMVRYPFDPALGRVGRAGGCLSEEWSVLTALLDAGETGWWVPDAKVWHMIPPSRQTRRYLRQYFILSGATPGAIAAAGAPRLFGRPRWLWRTLLQDGLLYVVTSRLAPARTWLPHLREASVAFGALFRREWS